MFLTDWRQREKLDFSTCMQKRSKTGGCNILVKGMSDKNRLRWSRMWATDCWVKVFRKCITDSWREVEKQWRWQQTGFASLSKCRFKIEAGCRRQSPWKSFILDKSSRGLLEFPNFQQADPMAATSLLLLVVDDCCFVCVEVVRVRVMSFLCTTLWRITIGFWDYHRMNRQIAPPPPNGSRFLQRLLFEQYHRLFKTQTPQVLFSQNNTHLTRIACACFPWLRFLDLLKGFFPGTVSLAFIGSPDLPPPLYRLLLAHSINWDTLPWGVCILQIVFCPLCFLTLKYHKWYNYTSLCKLGSCSYLLIWFNLISAFHLH